MVKEDVLPANGGENIFVFFCRLQGGGDCGHKGRILQFGTIHRRQVPEAAERQRSFHLVDIVAIDFEILDQDLEHGRRAWLRSLPTGSRRQNGAARRLLRPTPASLRPPVPGSRVSASRVTWKGCASRISCQETEPVGWRRPTVPARRNIARQTTFPAALLRRRTATSWGIELGILTRAKCSTPSCRESVRPGSGSGWRCGERDGPDQRPAESGLGKSFCGSIGLPRSLRAAQLGVISDLDSGFGRARQDLPLPDSHALRRNRLATRSRMAASWAAGAMPSGPQSRTPFSTCRFSPATRTMKNSSRLDPTMERNLTRSSRGTVSSSASSSTRRWNSRRLSSRFT